MSTTTKISATGDGNTALLASSQTGNHDWSQLSCVSFLLLPARHVATPPSCRHTELFNGVVLKLVDNGNVVVAGCDKRRGCDPLYGRKRQAHRLEAHDVSLGAAVGHVDAGIVCNVGQLLAAGREGHVVDPAAADRAGGELCQRVAKLARCAPRPRLGLLVLALDGSAEDAVVSKPR